VTQTARHAAPRQPLGRRALLPTVLLLASTGAFGGLALLPAPADAGAPQPSPVVRPANGALPQHTLSLAQAVTAERERARNRAATEAAVALRSAERASRSRSTRPPAPKPVPPKPAAPAAKPVAPPKPAPPAHVRPGAGRLTSTFGPRWGRLHAGIDLAAGVGAPIRAVAGGRVLSAGDEGGYGRCVRVQHPDGTVSLYAHLSEIHVRQGQPVGAGSVLGREGSSGNSTGPHLHFEIRIGGAPVDPLPWLKARGIDPGRL
jgi:murein DD-endopeptidase MepM/ murein hydrolase activator NlpD